jgi:hypothetical protein
VTRQCCVGLNPSGVVEARAKFIEFIKAVFNSKFQPKVIAVDARPVAAAYEAMASNILVQEFQGLCLQNSMPFTVFRSIRKKSARFGIIWVVRVISELIDFFLPAAPFADQGVEFGHHPLSVGVFYYEWPAMWLVVLHLERRVRRDPGALKL